MIGVKDILRRAVDEKASDVFIVAGIPVSYRKNGTIQIDRTDRLLPPQTEELLKEIYSLADRDINRLYEIGDDDFSLAIPGFSRFRVSAYKQRGALSAVMRIISFTLPDPESLHIPREIIELGNYTNGMVLVTGQAVSGKSTTLS